MEANRLVVALTVLNVVVLALSLGQAGALADGVAPVLRGRALEIVDDSGRVRASITILPADPNFKMPDGTVGYPETVLLRLINSKGRPNIKIAATERGAGQVLGGESDPTYVQILAEGPSTSLRLSNKDGQVQVVKPVSPASSSADVRLRRRSTCVSTARRGHCSRGRGGLHVGGTHGW